MQKKQAPPDVAAYRERLETLTERQQECLALLAEGFPPKKIAVILKIGPDQVYKHLTNAREHLGGIERSEAVRLFAAFQASDTSDAPGTQFLAPQSLGLFTYDDFQPDDPADDNPDAPVRHGGQLAEEQDLYILSRGTPALLGLMPIRSAGRLTNDLNPSKIMTAFALLTALALVLAGSAASLLSALDSLARP